MQVQDAHGAFDLYLAGKCRRDRECEASSDWEPRVSSLKFTNKGGEENLANSITEATAGNSSMGMTPLVEAA